jgi:hypothetical protein
LSETLFLICDIIFKKTRLIIADESLEYLRISFKMAMFLALYYITTVTKCKQKATQADMIAEAINKDKKKKNKGGDIELSKVVTQNMKMIIKLIKEALDIDFKTLWERKEVDQELFKRYTDVCVKILESNIAKD